MAIVGLPRPALFVLIVATALLQLTLAASQRSFGNAATTAWRRHKSLAANIMKTHRRFSHKSQEDDLNNIRSCEEEDDVELTSLLTIGSQDDLVVADPGLLRRTKRTNLDDLLVEAGEEEVNDDEDDDDDDDMEMTSSLLLHTRGGASHTLSETSVAPRGGARVNQHKNQPKKAASKVASSKDDSTAASMTSSVFNLVNNVAGAGILALSAGMTGGTGWIPAILLCVMLGIFSSHSFKIIGEACELTGEADFKV
jgi:Transmembrane amino acid transporter protein